MDSNIVFGLVHCLEQLCKYCRLYRRMYVDYHVIGVVACGVVLLDIINHLQRIRQYADQNLSKKLFMRIECFMRTHAKRDINDERQNVNLSEYLYQSSIREGL